MNQHQCRFCSTELTHSFVDLGSMPLANSMLRAEDIPQEISYPLHTYICSNCLLVQLPEHESPENIFRNYTYFSSFSKSWLQSMEEYSSQSINKFRLDSSSQVIEAASNDGYLLQFFQQKGIPVTGIEPARNVAKVAQDKGIPTITEFLGEDFAEQQKQKGLQADLLIANNVLAHVPDINDFVIGLQKLLKPQGVLSIEFPHVLQLIKHNQFDTIYHEHFSYLSVVFVKRLLSTHGLEIFDIEPLKTHGGSLRVWAQLEASGAQRTTGRVDQILQEEQQFGLHSLEGYLHFDQQVNQIRTNLLNFLKNKHLEGKKVVGYGAPAKGNTLINFCGINKNILPWTVDLNPAKQNLLLPGSHIPVFTPDKIRQEKPDYVLILPWNLKEEIREQVSFIKDWGGQFVVPIPELQVF